MSEGLTFTENAAAKVFELIQEEGNFKWLQKIQALLMKKFHF